MHTMIEALVRERMHEEIRRARRARLVRDVTTARRRDRWQARAWSAEQRHQRVQGRSTAVADAGA